MRRNMDVTVRVKMGTWVLTAIAATGMVAGCADGLRWGEWTPKSPPGSAPASPSSDTQEPDAPPGRDAAPIVEGDALVQVESFLESLRRYNESGGAPQTQRAEDGVAEAPMTSTGDGKAPASAPPSPEPETVIAQVGLPPADERSSVSNAAMRVPLEIEAEPREGSGEPAPAAIPVVEFVRIETADAAPSATASANPAGSSPGGANAAIDMRSPESTLSVDAYLHELRTRGAGLDPFEAWWRDKLMSAALGRIPGPEPETDAGAPATEAPDGPDASVTAGAPDRAGAPDAVAGALLDGVLNVAQEVHQMLRDPLADADAALSSVDDLRRRIAERAGLRIPAVAFCREVRSFGNYDTLPDDAFLVGRAVQAIVYVEVENLQCQPQAGDGFRTELSTRLELLDAEGGRSFWESEQGGIIDVCRSPRSDFFVAQRAAFPPTIPAGAYVLKVTVEDLLGRKTNQVNVPVTFHTPTSLASGG